MFVFANICRKLFTVNHKRVCACVWRTTQPCHTEHTCSSCLTYWNHALRRVCIVSSSNTTSQDCYDVTVTSPWRVRHRPVWSGWRWCASRVRCRSCDKWPSRETQCQWRRRRPGCEPLRRLRMERSSSTCRTSESLAPDSCEPTGTSAEHVAITTHSRAQADRHRRTNWQTHRRTDRQRCRKTAIRSENA